MHRAPRTTQEQDIFRSRQAGSRIAVCWAAPGHSLGAAGRVPGRPSLHLRAPPLKHAYAMLSHHPFGCPQRLACSSGSLFGGRDRDARVSGSRAAIGSRMAQTCPAHAFSHPLPPPSPTMRDLARPHCKLWPWGSTALRAHHHHRTLKTFQPSGTLDLVCTCQGELTAIAPL